MNDMCSAWACTCVDTYTHAYVYTYMYTLLQIGIKVHIFPLIVRNN